MNKYFCQLLLLLACSVAQAQTGTVNYTPYSVVTYVGYAAHGSFDGVGAAAQFDGPTGITADLSGNVFVADTNNHTIRKITPAGVVTTVAGTPGTSGFLDGSATSALFFNPSAIAVDTSGNLYVSDAGNNLIRKISITGVVTTLAGSPGSNAIFANPAGIAVDANGTVYFADTNNNAVKKISPTGVVTTLLGPGPNGITMTGTTTGIAVDAAGNVFVMGASFSTSTLFKLSPAGALTTVAALKATGFASFASPFRCALTFDAKGQLYIADNVNGVVLAVGADGTLTTLAASLPSPQGIAVDGNGNIYVAETRRSVIAKIAPGGTPVTFAGSDMSGGTSGADGIGRAARLVSPWGVAVDAQGVLYVGENSGNIRKILPGGIVTTLAGWVGHVGGSNDGVGADARFLSPYGVGIDRAGNVYVADADNFAIRKVTADGVVTTWAGAMGSAGSADGVGNAARFARPIGVAVDANGNVYVGDYGNSTIRKISPNAVVTTLAGTAGSQGSADGVGSEARFDRPTGVAVDLQGNVFVADQHNNIIRKITPAGVVTTVAGTAGVTGNADGVGAAAQFWFPTGIAVDAAGALFVTDGANNTVRRIGPDGVVTTLAGTPRSILNTSLDGVGSAVRFSGGPGGIAVDGNGNLFIADGGPNNEIRIASPRSPAIIASPRSAIITYGESVLLSP